MSWAENVNVNSVTALRREFDEAFAAAPQVREQGAAKFLAIRVAGDAYAVRVCEIGGLYADRRIVPLPTFVPELVGVAGFRGQLVPVYDLGALLGYGRQNNFRWLVLARWHDPVALAFASFDAHLTTGAEIVGEGESRAWIRGALRSDTAMRPIIHLPSVLEEIQRRAHIPAALSRSAR